MVATVLGASGAGSDYFVDMADTRLGDALYSSRGSDARLAKAILNVWSGVSKPDEKAT